MDDRVISEPERLQQRAEFLVEESKRVMQGS